jgi:hypothetical protein
MLTLLSGLLRRSWLLWNFGTQIIILLASLGLVLPFSPSMFKPGGAMEWVYVFLMSGQGGIQVTQVSLAVSAFEHYHYSRFVRAR